MDQLISKTAIVIPAYEPGENLVSLVNRLHESGQFVIVVDDGSSGASKRVFDELPRSQNVIVLKHATNLGKGRALKTAFNHFLLRCPDEMRGVVTADADGQHSIPDILKIASNLEQAEERLIVGSRSFTGEVPFRSFLGNFLTRYLFRAIVGTNISDTQSGLRGIPREFLKKILPLDGERYEYELNMLLAAESHGLKVVENAIQTIYIDGNKSSHFNPLIDSMRIYFLLFRFALSSAASFLIDLGLFIAASKATGNLFASFAFSRFISGNINFILNRGPVFRSKKRTLPALMEYYALLATVGALSCALFLGLHSRLGLGVLFSKVLADLILFIFSFLMQRHIVFPDF